MGKTGLISILLAMTVLAGCQSMGGRSIDDLPPTAAIPSTSEPGTVYAQYYDDVSGMVLDDLTASAIFPDQPTEVAALNQLARLTKRGNDYGTLVRGYIIPPMDGSYEFFVASDDESELFLSSDASADNLRQVAHVPRWTKAEDYSQYASQRSGSISLSGGNRYYFELLHKQAGGGDHFSVAWTGPNMGQQIISGDYLASWAPSAFESGDAPQSYSLGYRIGYFDGDKGLAFSQDYPPLDQDEDGLYDNWEVYYGLDPTDPSDASTDTDGDLLSAEEEFLVGTNPTNPDTSGDGLTDGEKYAYGLDPLDPDDLYVEIEGETVNLYEYLHGEPEPPALVMQNGFVGHYFASDRFIDFAFTRTDEAINFSWGNGSPDPAIPSDWFAVRWFAQIYPPHDTGTQTYQLNMRGDDGVRAWLNGEQVLSGWKAQAPTTYSATIELDAGQAPYELVAEYYEGQGGASVELWLSDPQTGTVIDQGSIFQRPVLDMTEQTLLVDSDADGIPDVWELSYGLNPWEDDAGTVHNSQGLTSLEAYQMGVHPWTLEDVSEPVEVTPPTTTSPDAGSGQITLSWTAPGTRTDGSSISLSEIDHYRVDYGQQIEDLSQTVDVEAGTTNYTFDGLATGTWYFQVYVVDTDGLVSPGSEVVSGEVQ